MDGACSSLLAFKKAWQMDGLVKLLANHTAIHGIDVTLRLLNIANKACDAMACIYDGGVGRRLETLSPKDKDKLWQLSKGAEDRVKFCKSVMVLIYENNR
jgi:hypothetical protein